MHVIGFRTPGFELNRMMVDMEVRGNHGLNVVKQSVLCRFVSGIDQDVAGQHDQARFNRPDVQVMDVLDSRYLFDRFHDFRGLDGWRRRL